MRLVARLRSALRSEDGFSLAELIVASGLGAIALTAMAIFLISSFKSGLFTEGQTVTINDARDVLLRIEKEVRGADSITWCAPIGNCLEVGAQTAAGGFQTVRYQLTGTELQRQQFNTATSTWFPLRTIVERVANSGTQPVFTCDTQSSLLRVNVDLHLEPTPHSDPNYNLFTSVRPRNFAQKATCPS